MTIKLTSTSTAARQTLRAIRRIHRLMVAIARKRGMLGQYSAPDSEKAEARAIKVCRRQRRKFIPLVQKAGV